MSNIEVAIRQLLTGHRSMKAQLEKVQAQYADFIKSCESAPVSITQEIDAIQGRRIFYTQGADQDFTIAQNGLRASAMTSTISQDGPFVATHYPFAIWKPNAPSNATNFGAWRPVSTWPLPTQELSSDFIDISYEVVDGGSQRNFQNQPVGPLLSRPDNLIPLPVPTMFAPNAVIQIFPTYERIAFNAAGTATTGGNLYIGIPGYRIVNM